MSNSSIASGGATTGSEEGEIERESSKVRSSRNKRKHSSHHRHRHYDRTHTSSRHAASGSAHRKRHKKYDQVEEEEQEEEDFDSNDDESSFEDEDEEQVRDEYDEDNEEQDTLVIQPPKASASTATSRRHQEIVFSSSSRSSSQTQAQKLQENMRQARLAQGRGVGETTSSSARNDYQERGDLRARVRKTREEAIATDAARVSSYSSPSSSGRYRDEGRGEERDVSRRHHGHHRERREHREHNRNRSHQRDERMEIEDVNDTEMNLEKEKQRKERKRWMVLEEKEEREKERERDRDREREKRMRSEIISRTSALSSSQNKSQSQSPSINPSIPVAAATTSKQPMKMKRISSSHVNEVQDIELSDVELASEKEEEGEIEEDSYNRLEDTKKRKQVERDVSSHSDYDKVSSQTGSDTGSERSSRQTQSGEDENDFSDSEKNKQLKQHKKKNNKRRDENSPPEIRVEDEDVEEEKGEEEERIKKNLEDKNEEHIDGDEGGEVDLELPTYYPAIQGCRSVEEFQCINRIEEGTYGVVYRARDKRTQQIVALKRLKMEKEKEGFPITSLREINTLLKAQHENIVTVREIVVGSNMDKIYIVMDFVEHDMKGLMESMKQPFLLGEVKTLMIQLLRAVAHMHDNWILHRDLKTSNLLLSHKGVLKVGDFGLAREYGSPLKNYTPIVVTLWYRAPELLLQTKQYSFPIDNWSVGCIFGEFLTLKPLFPGKSEIDQLNIIFKELGTPSEKIWPGYNELPLVKKVQFAEHKYNNLHNRLGTQKLTKLGFDLLNRFLTYSPTKRISADEALKHEFFKESPLPVEPSMFPTWPAKSEGAAVGAGGANAIKKPKSPKPPSGGKQYAKQLAGDDDDDEKFLKGFYLSLPSQGKATKGGFSLKF